MTKHITSRATVRPIAPTQVQRQQTSAQQVPRNLVPSRRESETHIDNERPLQRRRVATTPDEATRNTAGIVTGGAPKAQTAQGAGQDSLVQLSSLLQQADVSPLVAQIHLARWPGLSEQDRSTLLGTLNKLISTQRRMEPSDTPTTPTLDSSGAFNTNMANAVARRIHGEVAKANDALIAGFCAAATTTDRERQQVIGVTNHLTRQGIALASLLPDQSVGGSSGANLQPSAPKLEKAIGEAIGKPGVTRGPASAYNATFNKAFNLAMPTDEAGGYGTRASTMSANHEAKRTQRRLAKANADTVAQYSAQEMTPNERNLIMGFVNWATRNGTSLAGLFGTPPHGNAPPQAAQLLEDAINQAHGQCGMKYNTTAATHIRAFNRVFNLSMKEGRTPPVALTTTAAAPSTTAASTSMSTTTSTMAVPTTAAPTTAVEDDTAEIQFPETNAIKQDYQDLMDKLARDLNRSDQDLVQSFFDHLERKDIPWSTVEPLKDDLTPFALELAVNTAVANGVDPQVRAALGRALGVTLDDSSHEFLV